MLKKRIRTTKTDVETVRRVFAGLDEGEKFWKSKVGKNIIRILPSNLPDGNVAYHSILHYGFKIGGEKRAFPCLSVFNKPCPVCKIISLNDADSDPDIMGLLKDIGPRHTFLMNILDRNNPAGGPRIYSAPKSVMKEIYYLFNDDDYGDITDENEGRDIKIDKSGEGFTTRYATRVSPKETPIGVEDWIDGLFDLQKEAYREIPSYKRYVKYMEESFGDILQIDKLDAEEDDEVEEDDEGSDEVMELPIKRKKKTVAKKKKRPTSVEDF